MLVDLHVVCGDFRTTVTEFSSYFRSHMAHKVENIYYLASHRQIFPALAPYQCCPTKLVQYYHLLVLTFSSSHLKSSNSPQMYMVKFKAVPNLVFPPHTSSHPNYMI